MKQVSTILFYCFIGILGLCCFASLIITLSTTDNMIKQFKYVSDYWDDISNWFISVLSNIVLVVFAIVVALKSKKAISSKKELTTTKTCNVAFLTLSLVSLTTYAISFCFELTHRKQNLALYGVFAILAFTVSMLYVISLIKPFKEKTNIIVNLVALTLTLVISLASASLSALGVILSAFEIIFILCAAGNIVLENLDSLKASNN